MQGLPGAGAPAQRPAPTVPPTAPWRADDERRRHRSLRHGAGRAGAPRRARSAAVTRPMPRAHPCRAPAGPSGPPRRDRGPPAAVRARPAGRGRPVVAPGAGPRPRPRRGRSVAVATGTASGKSLCYQLPSASRGLAATAADAPGTALLLFPTKALAQDQLRALTALDLPGLVAAAYDGDSAPEERTWVRRNANVVLTNPDMLHAGMLPAPRPVGHLPHAASATSWSTSCTRSGAIFGTPRGPPAAPAAAAVRALRVRAHLRVLLGHHRQPRPRWPSALCGLDVTEVIDDGSPRGERARRAVEPAAARRAHRRPRVDQRRAHRGHRRPALVGARPPHHRVLPQPPRHRGRGRRRAPGADARPTPGRCAPTAAATWPPSGARSRPSCSAAGSGASWPRTRSSSASTSAGSTPACSTASPAPSPRCGSRPGRAGRDAPGRRWRCSWPATTSSTSG